MHPANRVQMDSVHPTFFIRHLSAMAAIYQPWPLFQKRIKSAFLNTLFDKYIFINQLFQIPQGGSFRNMIKRLECLVCDLLVCGNIFNRFDLPGLQPQFIKLIDRVFIFENGNQ